MSAYHRIVAAATLSNLGDGIRVVALPLAVSGATRDPVLVAGLTACSFLPWVLFGLPIGALVDRGRPEAFMLAANAGRAVLLTVLTVALLADVRSVVLLYGVAFLLGVGEAAYDNAAQSLLPRIVADDRLERANSALVTAERVGQDLVGPAVAGVLFAAVAALPFGLNAAAVLLAAALLLGIRTTAPAQARQGVRALFADMGEGLRWLLRPHYVRTLILTGTALTFLTMAWESTLVLLATGPMEVSEAGFGVLLAAGAVGGVAGAMITPWLVGRFERHHLQIAAPALCALVDLALAAFPTPATAALAWGGTGGAFAVWNVLSVTLRQRLVPAAMLARVNSAARMLSVTAVPLGALAGGAVAAWDLHAPAWISAIGLALLTGWYTLSSRSVTDPVAAGR